MSKRATPQETLAVLDHNIADVKAIARDQRGIADKQHATASRLEALTAELKEQASVLAAEIKEDAAADTRAA